jgi:replicative DNA helicase
VTTNDELELTDTAAERAVNAALFQYGYAAFTEIDGLINEKSFSLATNSILFRCFRHIFDKDMKAKPDVALIYSAAHSLGLQSQIDGADDRKLIRAISNFPVELANVQTHAAKLAKLDITRKLIDRLSGSIENLKKITGEEAIGHIMGIAEEAVMEFAASLHYDAANSGELLGETALEYVQHLMDNPVEQIGLKTGLPLWDESIGGGPKGGEVHVIGARAKTGKSFAANQIGLNIAAQDVPVFHADTELDKKMNIRRTVANLSGVKMDLIKTGKAGKDPSTRLKVEDAARLLKSIPYTHCSIAGQPPEETIALMRRWLIQTVGLDDKGQAAKRCCVIFDYLKLMDDSAITKNVAEYQALGFLVMALVNFALKYNVPIIAFCQLNRDGMTREDEGAAAGSDRIIWFCSSFSVFKWKSDEELAEQFGLPADQRHTHKLITVVARDGPALDPNTYINVRSEYHIGRLTEGPLNTNMGGASARPDQQGKTVDDNNSNPNRDAAPPKF